MISFPLGGLLVDFIWAFWAPPTGCCVELVIIRELLIMLKFNNVRTLSLDHPLHCQLYSDVMSIMIHLMITT